MKHLTVLALVFLLAACGGGGGGDNSPQHVTPQPAPSGGSVDIYCAGVYNEGQEQCITVTPGAQVWLGSVDRDRVIFMAYQISNTTQNSARVSFELNTTLGKDGCAGTQFLTVEKIASSTATIQPGQFAHVMAALYCPGAEIKQHQFQPAITVNGQRTFIDGVFHVAR